MAFLSSLTEDDYNKKAGDLIKSADWNALVSEVVSLGQAKADREGDVIHGELAVTGDLSVGGAVGADRFVVEPGGDGAANGLVLGEPTDSDWAIYRNAAGEQKSFAGKKAVAGNNFSGQALRIRTDADANSGLLVENQLEQLNFSLRASDGAAFVRGPLKIGGSELILAGQGGGAGNNNNAARALVDGGPTSGLIVNFGNDFGKVTVQSEVAVSGPVRAAAFLSNNQMAHRMYPGEPLVYQDIFQAWEAKVLVKLGTPGWNDQRHSPTSNNLWNDRVMLMIGDKVESDGNGAEVTIPTGYDTLWIRVSADTYDIVKTYFTDGAREQIGLWSAGLRGGNCYSPDGSLTDGHPWSHQWTPIPAGRAGKVALISKHTHELWISGLAFSKNPWAHSTQSALLGYHMGLNDSEKTSWEKDWDTWNGDVLSKIEPKTNLALQVPVLPSGRDKLLYLVEHNANWNGCMHSGIMVNDQPIERFISTYDNPFARHWNSKLYNRYIAARIPAALIPPNKRHLKVQIDMRKQNDGIHFREIGTHDMDIPTNY